MPIVEADLLRKLSIKTGTAGNQNAQADPNQSLGKYISTTAITLATLHNLFDQISGTENAALDVEYRCFFVHNNHASLTWQNVVAWLLSETAGGANIAIGVDPTAASAVGATAAQAVEVADEQTAPAGVAFSSPTTKGTGLSLGNIGPGQVKAIWLRRTATNSGALNPDGVIPRIEGETAA